MAELRIDTGVVNYDLNGKCTVSFNPTDAAFFQRIYDTFAEMDKEDTNFRETEDTKERFEIMRAADLRMRQKIDSVLDAPVCDSLFGQINVFAMSDGLPLWCNLMLTIMEECNSAIAREQMRTNPRIAKYTAKYHK